MKRKIIQRWRSFVMSQTAGLMNWNSELFAPKNTHGQIEWRDHVRWWIEGKLETVFSWAYDGSDEEIEQVFSGEMPLDCMNDRQRAAMPPRIELGAHCVHCRWDGWLEECNGDFCPVCGEGVYLDEMYKQLIEEVA